MPAWNQLCQHSRGSVRSGGFLWQRAFLAFTTTFSCSRNDASPTTSSILVNMESNMVMLTLLASFSQTLTHLIHAVMWYISVCLSECLMRIFMHFTVVSWPFLYSVVLWFSQILPLSSFWKLCGRFWSLNSFVQCTKPSSLTAIPLSEMLFWPWDFTASASLQTFLFCVSRNVLVFLWLCFSFCVFSQVIFLILSYQSLHLVITTAVINIFILTVDQMTMCDVKGVSHSDKPKESFL